jgi:hypothetical protein
MTYVKPVMTGTSTPGQNKSYLLRKGSQDPALRSPPLGGRNPAVKTASGFEHRLNQAQYSSIGHLLRH